jgi:hypothetical protein
MPIDILDSIISERDKQQSNISLLLTCVNYSDYLEETINYNTNIFDNIYVITTPEDILTQKICSLYNNITIYKTSIFTKHASSFNKGAALNEGLKLMPKNQWILVGDSDCIYPECIKKEIKNLDKNKLYSYPRHNVKNKKHLQDIFCHSYPPILLKNKNVKTILGYCQIFHSSSFFFNKNPHYSTRYKNASRSDIAFSSKWPRQQKQVLNCGYVLHLGETGINWSGRKSGKWE